NAWIDGEYTKITNPAFNEAAAQQWDPNYAAVKTQRATLVYRDSSYGSGRRSSVGGGTILQVVSTLQNGGILWYELSNGGWIPASVATPITTYRAPVSLRGQAKATAVQAVITAAKQQLGKPYVWNGKGPDGFDCSGLMQFVFKQALGQNIGSWTVPQETAGTQVAIKDLQPGDLVFWG
ncbi:peptidoglycan endopeptidase, partial [Lactobacillus sp. XV13L]|nr:peptidoglycan endopeptidase [Lactobacillus sp. XV13L]